MLRRRMICLAALVCCWSVSSSAEATPYFLAKFRDKYAKNQTLVSAVQSAKCNVCHVDGKPKKIHNSYGDALHKLGLNRANYSAKRIKMDAAQAEKELFEFFDKAAAEKGPDGKPFGDAIKEGKLPIEQ